MSVLWNLVQSVINLWGTTETHRPGIEEANDSDAGTRPIRFYLWYNGRTYTIEAPSQPPSRYDGQSGPMLYLRTSCLGIADYCLLGRWSELVHGDRRSYFEPTSQEYIEITLRLKRCGAVNMMTPPHYRYEDGCAIELEEHLNNTQYVFGWPSRSPETPGQEPMLVYYIFRSDRLRRQGFTRHTGAEGQLGLDWLVGCTTMDEYCERLRIRGARFYNDATRSPEAQRCGLVERDSARSEHVKASLVSIQEISTIT